MIPLVYLDSDVVHNRMIALEMIQVINENADKENDNDQFNSLNIFYGSKAREDINLNMKKKDLNTFIKIILKHKEEILINKVDLII